MMSPEVPTVLLIGGRSFIGGHICRVLIKRGYKVLLHSTSTSVFDNLSDVLPHPQVTPVTCRYDNKDQLAKLMAQADFVIYLAVPPHKQSLGQSKAREQDFTNFKHIVEGLFASPAKKSVFISTCSTIGKLESGFADENSIATKPQGWYGMEFKFKLENFVMDYVRRGLKTVIVNPTMFVGDYDTRPSSGEFFRFFDKAPFISLKGERMNIIDIADAGLGVVLALEKGRVGERYILGGENILVEELVARIKKCGGKKVPKLAIPYSVSVATAFISELLNLVLHQEKPLMPLLGIELTRHGTQHFSIEKAKRELGFVPGDAWAAVDRAYAYYKSRGIL